MTFPTPRIPVSGSRKELLVILAASVMIAGQILWFWQPWETQRGLDQDVVLCRELTTPLRPCLESHGWSERMVKRAEGAEIMRP